MMLFTGQTAKIGHFSHPTAMAIGQSVIVDLQGRKGRARSFCANQARNLATSGCQTGAPSRWRTTRRHCCRIQAGRPASRQDYQRARRQTVPSRLCGKCHCKVGRNSRPESSSRSWQVIVMVKNSATARRVTASEEFAGSGKAKGCRRNLKRIQIKQLCPRLHHVRCFLASPAP
jgi:hypothetical protein